MSKSLLVTLAAIWGLSHCSSSSSTTSLSARFWEDKSQSQDCAFFSFSLFYSALAWDFLSPHEWFNLMDERLIFTAYAQLQRSAITVSIQSLCLPHQPIGIERGLTHEQAWQAAVALL
jgi:hypothetical protein